MSTNIETDNSFYKYKYNKEIINQEDQSNNSHFILKKYQTFVINDSIFKIGIINKDNLYFGCKINGNYFKRIMSKENIYLMNEIFHIYKNIKDIFKLIILSMSENKVKMEIMKNNRIKLIISIKNEKNTPSPLEILLKPEDQNLDEQQNNSKKKIISNNEFNLIKDSDTESIDSNDNNTDKEKDNSQIYYSDDESQDEVNNNTISEINEIKENKIIDNDKINKNLNNDSQKDNKRYH